MSNAISVLLIIGSAVVGPIDAKPEKGHFDFPPGITTCVYGKPHGATQVDCSKIGWIVDRPAESLPELCERAMREIGASKWGEWKSEPIRSAGWSLDIPKEAPKGFAGAVTRGPDVHCIPTPEGYRK